MSQKYYFRCTTAKPTAPLFITTSESDAKDMRTHPDYVEVQVEEITEAEKRPQAQLPAFKQPEGRKMKLETGLKAVAPKVQ